MAHLHKRDENGNGTMDKNKLHETVELLRKNHPDCDIIINMTTSGALTANDEERKIHVKELRPEMASYDCGSMNWLNTGLFLNPPAFLEQLGKDFQEWGVKPEIEAFDPGMIANAAYYLKKGVLKAPLHFQFCMGCANGIHETVSERSKEGAGLIIANRITFNRITNPMCDPHIIPCMCATLR